MPFHPATERPPTNAHAKGAGRCDVNGLFLMLSMTGSLALMLYALMRGDAIFSTVNALTTLGALVNTYYRQFPRISSGS